MEVDLPALAGGEYLLDAIGRDAQGCSVGWGTWAVSVDAVGVLSVALEHEAYQPGQPAAIAAQVADAPDGDYTATLQVWDSLDRLLYEETQPLAAGRARWTFPNRDPLCVLHYADVQIRRNGRGTKGLRTALQRDPLAGNLAAP